MTQKTNIDKKARPSRRRLYIFSVTFLAMFLVCLFFAPSNKLEYRIRSMLSVESQDSKPLKLEDVQNRLIAATSELLSDKQLGTTIDRIAQVSRKSELLSQTDYEKIRSSIHIGVKELQNDQQQLISVAMIGSGTPDERAFINLLASNLIEKIQHSEIELPSFDKLAKLQFELKVRMARQQGIENFRTILLSEHFKRVQEALNPESVLPESRNVQASTAAVSNEYRINPAWQSFSIRKSELTTIQEKLLSESQKLSSKINLATVEEELHWINNQLEIEPKYLSLVQKETSELPARKPIVTEAAETNTGQTVRIKNRFQKASHQTEKEEVDHAKFFRDGYLVKTHGILTELDLRSSQVSREQDEIVLASRQSLVGIKVPEPKTRYRIVQTAERSNQLNSSINTKQLLWILIIGVAFASILTIQADWRVDGNSFISSEDVSRKLGVPVLGTLGVSNDKTQMRSTIIRYAIASCELAIVGFAAVMLVIAVSNNSIGIQMLTDPINGIVNATKSIWG